MAYRFNGTSDYVEFNIAPLLGYTVGNITMAALVYRAGTGQHAMASLHQPSPFVPRASHRFLSGGQNSVSITTVSQGAATYTTGSWYIVAVTYQAGGGNPRFHSKLGSTWTHEIGSGSVSSQTCVSGDQLRVGTTFGGSFFNGDIVCVGIKKADRTDAQIETLSLTSFQAWRDFGFDWLIGFDPSLTVSGLLQDQASPGTGDETSKVGTSVVADPPGWSWASPPPSGSMTKIKFGTDLVVTDEGAGVIRVDTAAPNLAGKVDRDSVVAATARIVASKLAAGDAQPAFRILGDGKIQWGPGGGTAPDTSLYRLSATVLWVDSSLAVGQTFASKAPSGVAFIADNYGAAEAGMLQAKHAAEANLRFQITSYGKLQWGPGTAGLDTVLYRGATNEVKTDGAVRLGGMLFLPFIEGITFTGSTEVIIRGALGGAVAGSADSLWCKIGGVDRRIPIY